ncbi:hypothetical protein EVAR_45461_1, partial [Eumeta japonica]
ASRIGRGPPDASIKMVQSGAPAAHRYENLFHSPPNPTSSLSEAIIRQHGAVANDVTKLISKKAAPSVGDRRARGPSSDVVELHVSFGALNARLHELPRTFLAETLTKDRTDVYVAVVLVPTRCFYLPEVHTACNNSSAVGAPPSRVNKFSSCYIGHLADDSGGSKINNGQRFRCLANPLFYRYNIISLMWKQFLRGERYPKEKPLYTQHINTLHATATTLQRYSRGPALRASGDDGNYVIHKPKYHKALPDAPRTEWDATTEISVSTAIRLRERPRLIAFPSASYLLSTGIDIRINESTMNYCPIPMVTVFFHCEFNTSSLHHPVITDMPWTNTDELQTNVT